MNYCHTGVLKFVDQLVMDGWKVWYDRTTDSVCGSFIYGQKNQAIVKRWPLKILEQTMVQPQLLAQEETNRVKEQS